MTTSTLQICVCDERTAAARRQRSFASRTTPDRYTYLYIILYVSEIRSSFILQILFTRIWFWQSERQRAMRRMFFFHSEKSTLCVSVCTRDFGLTYLYVDICCTLCVRRTFVCILKYTMLKCLRNLRYVRAHAPQRKHTQRKCFKIRDNIARIYIYIWGQCTLAHIHTYIHFIIYTLTYIF